MTESSRQSDDARDQRIEAMERELFGLRKTLQEIVEEREEQAEPSSNDVIEPDRMMVGMGDGVRIFSGETGFAVQADPMPPEFPPTEASSVSLSDEVEFGKPTAAFSSGTTITLDPCDENGVDNGLPNITVHVATDGGTVEADFETTDVLRFVRYRLPDASDVGGVLVGLQPVGTCVAPKSMYGTFEGLEAAQTDTWDRTSQGANDGVSVKKHMRTVYNDGGDEKLYGYWREFKYDSRGNLLSISAETRYEIDPPDACP